MIPVRRALGALLAPVLLVLPACGGEPSAIPDPPIASPSSPTSTHQPPRRETAEHFIRRWAAEGTRMQNTGDVRRYLTMSRDCQGCEASARLINQIYERGGSVSWGGWRIRRVVEMPRKGFRFLDLYVNSAATSYRPSKGAAEKRLSGGRLHYQVQVKPAGESWAVTSFIQVAS